jgi:hypothetical protein
VSKKVCDADDLAVHAGREGVHSIIAHELVPGSIVQRLRRRAVIEPEIVAEELLPLCAIAMLERTHFDHERAPTAANASAIGGDAKPTHGLSAAGHWDAANCPRSIPDYPPTARRNVGGRTLGDSLLPCEGFTLLPRDEIAHVLKKYWTISEHQAQASVVLSYGCFT